MKIFTLILLFVAIGIAAKAVDPREETIKYVNKAPTIDGIIDENDTWDETWFEEWTPKINNANTTSDMSAKLNVLASKDKKFIYIAVQVEDATEYYDPVAITTVHERDCTEAFFSMDTAAYDNTGTTGTYKAGSWQIRTFRSHPDATVKDSLVSLGADKKKLLFAEGSGYEIASETTPDGYIQEFAYPVEVLVNGGKFDDTVFRFDFQVADNTTGANGGRTQQIYWNTAATDNQWQNTRDFGIMFFGDELSTGVKNIKAVNGKATVKNNLLNISNVNGQVSIIDMKGAVVRKATINGKGSINIADMKSGIYVVKGKDIAAKFVK